jgi:hypothetical protein
VRRLIGLRSVQVVIYCMIPSQFEAELYEAMRERYADRTEVTVIVDAESHPASVAAPQQLRGSRGYRAKSPFARCWRPFRRQSYLSRVVG